MLLISLVRNEKFRVRQLRFFAVWMGWQYAAIDIKVQDEKGEIMLAAGDRKRGKSTATRDRVPEFVTPPAELVSMKLTTPLK